MAVVINEFEVVPAERRAGETQPPAPRPAAEAQPQNMERQVERLLERRRARMARLTAI
jgi:hypothetical protein